jgi:hypothetical protein
MSLDSIVFLALVMWKIATFIVPCVAFGLIAVWVMKKCGIDL